MAEMTPADYVTIIEDILEKYPEDQWLKKCKKALPDTDEGIILAAIEILCGGDLKDLA
jgi:hypothetical protein